MSGLIGAKFFSNSCSVSGLLKSDIINGKWKMENGKFASIIKQLPCQGI
jgi:hypothetical protein